MLPHPLNWDLSDWTFRMGMFQTIRLVALHDYQIMHYHYSSWLLKHCSNLYHVKSIAHNWKELIKKNNASLPMWTHDSWILPFDIFSLLHMVLTTTSPNKQKTYTAMSINEDHPHAEFRLSTTLLIQILPPVLLTVANMVEAAWLRVEAGLIST